MNQRPYCGKSCLFRTISPDAFPLSASARSEPSWVSGRSIIRIISKASRVVNHPLYSSEADPSRTERRNLLTVVMDRKPAYVAPVIALCNCSFEMPFIEGIPLRDFGLGPDANRLMPPQNRRPSWSPEALQAFLRQLVSGLQELHLNGVAHGDPALMNAMVADATEEAFWVDLNSVRAATDINIALDTTGFIELCLWPSLLEGNLYSPTLFADILDAVETAPDILALLSEVLANPRSDYRSGDARTVFASAVRKAGPLSRSDQFGRTHRHVCAYMSSVYFLDYTLSDQTARFYRSVLDAERTRHCVIEEEATRLHYLRFQNEAKSAQETLAAYEAGKAWLEEQVQNWQQVADQRQETLVAYEGGKAWLAEQVRSWQQLAAALQRQLLELEDSRHQEAKSAQEALASYEAGKAWLAEQVRSWQQLAGEAQHSLSGLEIRVNNLSAELEARQQAADEQARVVEALAEARIWLLQQVDNWQTAAEQGTERIAVLEETITTMRATRAWRTAEWAVAVSRRFRGVCSGILLAGSPRLVRANVRNFILACRLALRGAEGRAIWHAHFDAEYYKQTNADVAGSGISPLLHYLLCGYRENRNPSGSFDSAYYDLRNPDVHDAGINPLLHYALFGHQEQRIPAPPPNRTTDVSRPASLPRHAPRAAEAKAPGDELQVPLVSVIIPCFNYGDYVEDAIRSVLAQTFTSLEVIVVEGGSTDGKTPGILKSLEKKGVPRTRFVYRREPHLVGDNRNFGIGLARGRYICCLDADDLLKPNYIEIAVFLAELYGYDIVYPSVRCFAGSDFHWLLSDPTWPDIATGNQISTVAMFRKTAWEFAGGFRDWGKGDQHVPEDWALWVRLVGLGFQGKSIREPLMLYRVHANGLWATRAMSLENQLQAIREANPELFVDGFVPVTPALDRRPVPRKDLVEPSDSQPAILLALPFITIGGAEKLFSTLAQSLIEKGYKVVVITTLVLADTIRDCTESFETVTPYLYPFPRLLENQEDRWKDFLFYLLERHRIGTILIAGCNFVYRLLPEIDCNFPQIAVFDQLFNDGVHFVTNRQYAHYIDTTFVPSRILADKLISECGEQQDKVCVIPHGIDIDEIDRREATFESSGLPQDFRGKFLVSFFGRLSIEKGPADFVEIANLLRSHDEIRFLMTGEGAEREAVLKLIARYGLQERIYTPGFVDDVGPLISLSDVVVVPSHLDGMPLVIFEAQACGKPVVASVVGSIPHMIADGTTGFLCTPRDIGGFAGQILKLYRSPEMRRVVGEAALVWVRANHSAESMTAKYIETIEKARGAIQ